MEAPPSESKAGRSRECNELRSPGSLADRADLLHALLCAIALSIFFFAVYNTCNAITAHRSDVGRAGFAWERHMPFIPWMIVPYMSIDLFFFASPFFCTTRRQRREHVRRLLLAITIAGACFLIFPLTMTLLRPAPTGAFAPIFRFLYGFDKPYNLAPSLHITLRTLLWVVYVPQARGLPRLMIQTWFILIGVSTLVTYQHQVIDVVTGQFLALCCLHAIPERSDRLGQRRWRIAGRYGLGAMLCAAGAYALRPWGLLLLWPAAALGLVAWAYLGAGAAIYRKRAGRLPLSTYIVFGPYLLGTRLAFIFHRARDVAYSEVRPGLFIGRRMRNREADALVKNGITAVLDLTAECPEARAFRQVAYLNVSLLDLTPPTLQQLADGARFIRDELTRGRVYVHCAWGYSRSACMAAAYLLASGEAASATTAIDQVRSARPNVVLSEAAVGVLRAFEPSNPPSPF